MKDKMNSLARSNASLYAKQHANGGQEELYDRLRRHAYQGKKSGKKWNVSFITIAQNLSISLSFRQKWQRDHE